MERLCRIICLAVHLCSSRISGALIFLHLSHGMVRNWCYSVNAHDSGCLQGRLHPWDRRSGILWKRERLLASTSLSRRTIRWSKDCEAIAWAAPVQKGHQHGLHDTAVPISLVYQFQELKNNVMAVLSDNPQFGDPQPDLSS
jgi:hypothetical protein